MRVIDADSLSFYFRELCCGNCKDCKYESKGKTHCGLINNAPTVEMPEIKDIVATNANILKSRIETEVLARMFLLSELRKQGDREDEYVELLRDNMEIFTASNEESLSLFEALTDRLEKEDKPGNSSEE